MSARKVTKRAQSPVPRLKVERLSTMAQKRRDAILRRSAARYDAVAPVVERVMKDVRDNGDAALLKYTRRFDKVTLKPGDIRVSKADIRKAYKTVKCSSPELIPAIQASLDCIRGYHEGEAEQLAAGLTQWEKTVRSRKWSKASSVRVGQLRTPIECVGAYVPGGNAVLLTSALMAVTPAKVAGVDQVVVASPPSRSGDIDPRIVVAADMAGADVIIRAGGAQAVAAMAYGTKSVPRVAKIVGPGNVFVAAAKSYAAATGLCAIDLPAGPSEILVIADATADPEFIARDMLSQSEHDLDASAVLVTTSDKIARAVSLRIAAEFKNERRTGAKPGIAEQSIGAYGAIVLAKSLNEAISFANEFAPEHLEIMTSNPRKVLPQIRNAGGIFLGKYSPVAIGDYVCPNHILPTGGAARFTSGVSINTFLKTPSFLEVPRKMVKTLDSLVETLSKAEGLYAQHGKSVKARLGK